MRRIEKNYDKNKILYLNIFRIVKFIILFLLIISIISFFSYKTAKLFFFNDQSMYYVKKQWKNLDYQSVYDVTTSILYRAPFNSSALIFHGYASFFLASGESDNIKAQNLLDEAIISMRQATLFANDKVKSQLYYTLGKAYFYKNQFSSSYYYADLVIKYLNQFGENYDTIGANPNEIAEIIGLCYADLGMPAESNLWFTKALSEKSSDFLLLSIAEQYNNLKQYNIAEQYLYRISESCKDEKILMRSRFLLGEIYTEQERYEDAIAEFKQILEKNENSADALYGLGVIYEKQGDIIKARSEWRKVLRIQENHIGALKKLLEYK